eukprot:67482_1
MSHMNKRKLSELSHISNDNEQEPQNKRQKIMNEEQFSLIFQSINSSELINKIQVPSSVIQEIAAYSVGYLYQCKNMECMNKVVILQSDFDEGIFSSEENKYYKWNGCNDGGAEKNCYCSECMTHTEPCNDCNNGLLFPTKCTFCDFGDVFPVTVCDNDYCDVSHCDDCDKILCYGCSTSCCYGNYCPECASGKYKNFTCGSCDNYIGATHKNCNPFLEACDEREKVEWLESHDFTFCANYLCETVICVKCALSVTCEQCERERYVCQSHGNQLDVDTGTCIDCNDC